MTEAKGPSVGPKAPSVQRLVIDRRRWLRGEGSPRSWLRRIDGQMCCLGFLGLACGFRPEAMTSRESPAHLIDPRWPRWLQDVDGEHTEAARLLMRFNDSMSVTPASREQQIARIFAEHGIEVVFTDGEASAASARNAPPESSAALSTEGKEK